MVSLQYISDLHLEFYSEARVNFDDFVTKSADYIALLGDIGYPTLENYKNFIEDCSRNFLKVFVITGNHEYYTLHPKQNMNMNMIDQLIQNICSSFTNVYFLNNEEHILCSAPDKSNDIILVGTTLWSKISQHELKYIQENINDYKNILDSNNVLISCKYINKLFTINLQWLAQKLEEHRDKTIIVLTHHSPSYKSISTMYKNCQGNSAFANNLVPFITQNTNIKYWLFGHTHATSNFVIGQTICCANPAGYNHFDQLENQEYKKNQIIII